MKRAALLLSLLIGFFAYVPVIRAYEAAPWVLAVTSMRKPTPLPKIVVGREVAFDEMADQDLVTAGGTVNVGGVVKNNLVAAGGQVILSGDVKGNVIVLGGFVRLEEGAHVAGYLLIAGGQVELLGKVDGDVRTFGSDALIGDKSVFGGSLTVDASKIKADEGAKISGEKKLTEIKANGKMPWGYWKNTLPQGRPGLFAGVFTVMKLAEFVGKIALMLIFIKIMGGRLAELTKRVKADFWTILGWGALKLFLTPILILLLLMSVVGIPVAIFFVGLYVGAIFLSGYISSAILGHWLVMKGWLANKNLYVQGVVGLLVLEVIGLVPVIGWLIKFGAVLVGLGLVVRWEKSLLSMKA